MSSAVRVIDSTPLLFKALAWEKYYRTQFPDSPDERPEFNSIIYDKSSAEFKALLFDVTTAQRNQWLLSEFLVGKVVLTRYDHSLLFKALAWEKYYRTEFPDSPDERPEFNIMIYDESSAEFKDLLFDADKPHLNGWRDKIASN